MQYFQFTGRLHRVVRLSTELELNAVSIERINEYTEKATEVCVNFIC